MSLFVAVILSMAGAVTGAHADSGCRYHLSGDPALRCCSSGSAPDSWTCGDERNENCCSGGFYATGDACDRGGQVWKCDQVALPKWQNKKAAPPKSDCEAREILEIAKMPPVRSQDSLGVCYGFSALALIQHKYCKAKGGCSYKKGADDRLSSLDAILTGTGGTIADGGDSEVLLKNVMTRGTLALESCSPFSNLANNQTNAAKLDKLRDWVRSIQRAKYLSTLSSTARIIDRGEVCRLHGELSDLIGIQVAFEELSLLIESIDKMSPEVVVGMLVLPQRCQDARVKVPSFKVRTLYAERKSLTAQVNRLISEDKPVLIYMCTDLKDAQCEGQHASVIAGKRQYCCGGKCRLQYKMHDSSGVFWGKESMRPWVDGEELNQRIVRYQNVANLPAVRWIE